MDKTEILIIGAGVVGLAIAEKLSQNHEVVLVEQEHTFGQHTSSRNSEVIHSGIYYPPGFLKAKLCVRGNELLYQFLEKENIPHKKCQKYVIATCPEEVPKIEALKANGEKNNVPGLKLVDQKEMNSIEPQVKAIMGLLAPTTGIMDVHILMQTLLRKSEKNGAIVAFFTKVTGLKKIDQGYIVSFADGYELEAKIVINSAGLFCDQIAQMLGIDIDKAGYRLHYCKGEYYKTFKIKNINHLIYPVPRPDGRSLGIHIRLHLDGTIAFGPNAYYVDSLNYSMDETHKKDFYESIKKYIDIDYDALNPDDTGIRPKLQIPGGPVRDFVIKNEVALGLPNFINLIGIESPGLTSCLAIAEYVATLLP
jgi:L-2-hydroxyglutarate oxidase LhgO